MNVLSLFSGIGGIDVAVKLVLPGAKTVAYVERDKHCQVLLKARMNDGSLDTASIIDDVRSPSVLDIKNVDMIAGGFPCQPFSFAGLRKENDERNLWPEFINTIRSIRPRYVFLENVPGILTSREHEGYIFTILKDLYQNGYDAEWGTLTASAIGASHKRERWFCLAWRRDLAVTNCFKWWSREKSSKSTWKASGQSTKNSSSKTLANTTSERGERWRTGLEGEQTQSEEGVSGWSSARELADTTSERLQGIRLEDQGEPCETSEALLQRNAFIEHEFPPGPTDYEGWARVLSEMPEVEPSFCIEADGISKSLVISRSQALKMLGNSVVPQQVAAALTVLWNRMVNA